MKSRIYLLLFAFVFSLQSANAQKEKYEVFASSKVNLKTGTLASSPAQCFITIIKNHNRFTIGNENFYDVYNEVIKHDGFQHYWFYDAVDKYKQRCKFMIAKDESAQPNLQWSITIMYEGSDIGLMYQSNHPKRTE